MNGIIYDARKIKAYEDLKYLGELTGKSEEFINGLWEGMLLCEELFQEFLYYLDHHCLMDKMKYRGYSLTDLYVWQLDRYNIVRDMGKHGAACNKEGIVLDTFQAMLDLRKDPEHYIKHMTDGQSMDRM